jgi:hypothetical protein
MHFSTAFVALVAPFLVSAAPWKRAASKDVAVLREYSGENVIKSHLMWHRIRGCFGAARKYFLHPSPP